VQAILRIPLPESLLEEVARPAGSPSSRSVRSAGWGPLEAAVHESVFAWLPTGARRVRLAWDAGRREVVARFEITARDGREP
jgi:hypothetical protein